MNLKVFALAFLLTLAAAAAYAQSQSEIWNKIFDSATSSLRVVIL